MSGFLLDTNVVSETLKPNRSQSVIGFLETLENGYLSVVTLHELAYGLERLPQGSKQHMALSRALEELLATFVNRILVLGHAEARAAGALRAGIQRDGRTMHIADAMIAGTALVHGLTVATRNVKDFQGAGVLLRDPWNLV
jgi:toxin FitB